MKDKGVGLCIGAELTNQPFLFLRLSFENKDKSFQNLVLVLGTRVLGAPRNVRRECAFFVHVLSLLNQ